MLAPTGSGPLRKPSQCTRAISHTFLNVLGCEAVRKVKACPATQAMSTCRCYEIRHNPERQPPIGRNGPAYLPQCEDTIFMLLTFIMPIIGILSSGFMESADILSIMPVTLTFCPTCGFRSSELIS
jgi:uncharacterized membrane protein YqaE (UPF0057 family)